MKNTKLFAMALLIIAFTAMVWRFWDILMLFFSAAFVAFLLYPLSNYLSKTMKIKRGIAITIVILFFFALLIVIVSFTVPLLVSQITSLTSEITKLGPQIEEGIKDVLAWFEALHLPSAISDTIYGVVGNLDNYIASFLTALASSLLGFTSQIMDSLVFIILTIYFMLDGDKLLKSLFNTLPKKLRGRAESIVRKADDVTWKYIKSKIIISFFVSVATYIGFILMDIKYAFVFCVVVFFLNFIPYFGSLIAGALPIAFCLFTAGFGKAIAVLIFTLVIQQIEGNIVTPKIQGDLTGIHPITVMFAILASNSIWGPMGMIIAVPLAAVLKMCFSEAYQYVVSDLN